MKRTVKIFGKSVPLSAILLGLAITATVAAAFLLVQIYTGNVSAQGGPTGTFSDLTCTITQGPGTVDTCIDNGDGTVDYAVSGIDDDTCVMIHQAYNPGAQLQLYTFSYDDITSNGISSVTPNKTDGWEPPVTVDTNINVTICYGDMVPNEVISGWQFQHSFSRQ